MSYRSPRGSVFDLQRTLQAVMVALLLAGSLGSLAVPASAEPASPELTAPTDGAVVDGLPFFTWTLPSGPGGTSARLEIAADADFSHIVTVVETTGLSHQQIE